MTIKNYTFLSPSGTEFPVSATADRRLYLMLGGMNYADYKMKHWVTPVNSGFNRIYMDTSFIIGGAYFELFEQAVVVSANTTNYIHINIDLSNVSAPVFITVETQENSNNVDINSNSGILKKCIEIVITSASSIVSVQESSQDSDLIKQLKLAMNPIGSIITTTNSTNPTSYIGGVWERYGKGQVLVGVDENDADFNETGKTGGEKTHALTEPEMPSHTHDISLEQKVRAGGTGYTLLDAGTKTKLTSSSAGGNQAHNNLQPYVAVYMFRRTA